MWDEALEGFMHRMLCTAFLLLATALPADARIIPYDFHAELIDGPLAGTAFPGTFSYDDAQVTGIGTEYIALASLHFTIGVPFDRSDINQGGQVILNNGAVDYFTAAFFPPPPDDAPVSDIAFGFGGPGVIGYVAGNNEYGSGFYTFAPAVVSEPGFIATAAFALLGWLGWRRRSGGAYPSSIS